MNLLVSYQWLREYAPTDLTAEEYAARVSLCGPAIERMHDTALALADIVVGRVTEVRAHPNAQKLKIAIVDVGKGLLEIVCGGTNLAVGQRVAVAKIGSRVRWHGEGDMVTLAEADIRGVKSFGMIAAANEIGLYDLFPHTDREILDLSFLPDRVQTGMSLAEALEMNDTVFDIEVTTNRPDAYSTVGMAREAAAILGVPFQEKIMHERTKMPRLPDKDVLPLAVSVAEPTLCPRYQAVALHGLTIGTSPLWLRRRLVAGGIRPINAAVDISNYVMLEFGQPLHVFDYHALAGAEIQVRKARPGETMQALDGTACRFSGDELVIADQSAPVAVAGVMGGAQSGIKAETTSVVVEAAVFDALSVRRTARALNLHTDASLRFEKGLSPEGTALALARAVQLFKEVCGAKGAGAVKDVRVAAHAPRSLTVRPAVVAEVIGVPVPAARQISILKSLGCAVKGKGAQIEVVVPWWRDADIEGERDIAEEVARIWGYHNLPSVLPSGVPPLRPEDPLFALEQQSKDLLAGMGWVEVMSYSLVSQHLLRATGFEDRRTITLQNPLNQDLTDLRPDLVPSLLAVARDNAENVPAAGVFEIANVYLEDGDALPTERLMCGLLHWGASPQGEQFFTVKGAVERLLTAHVDSYTVTESRGAGPYARLAHPGRRAEIVVGGEVAGYVAEVHPEVCDRLGLQQRAAFAVLDMGILVRTPRKTSYVPPPAFPAVKRDIAFFVSARVTHAALIAAMRQAHPLLTAVERFDVYAGKGVPAGQMSVAYHLQYRSPDHTLTADEAQAAHAAVVDMLKKTFAIEVRE